MFKGSFTVATISGVPVRVHWSFFLLLVWAFSSGALGAGGSVNAGVRAIAFVTAIFVCIVAHEFGHILAARCFGIRTRDVTLLPIGGVAALERIPDKPWQELVVALAGPLVNVVIVAAIVPGLLISRNIEALTALSHPDSSVRGFLASLAAVNVWLVIFNLIPAFPMDGGRVLRALLAMITDRARATSIAAAIGQLIAVGMAVTALVLGRPMLLVLALFIFFGARAEAAGTLVRERLRAMRMSDAMLHAFRVLGEHQTIGTAAAEAPATPQSEFPVTRDGAPRAPIVGVVTRADLARALAELGPGAPVRDAMRAPAPAMAPAESVWQAAVLLQRPGCPLVPVVENGALVGIVTGASLAQAMSARAAPDRRAAGASVHSPR